MRGYNGYLNVLYCCDGSAYAGLEASIYSLLTHTKQINIFVFSMEYHRDIGDGVIMVFPKVDEYQQAKLKKIVKYLDSTSHITFIDTLNEYKTYFLQGVNEDDGHSSPYAPLRLIIDVVLPELPHVLYLDCDTIIQRDLRNMYFNYLTLIENANDNVCYAAYPNELYDDDNNLIRVEMVAGIILFHMDKAKEYELLPKARYNITHYVYPWYDQSALEAAGKYIALDETYNYMRLYEERGDEHPAIMHFACDLNPKIYFDKKKIFYKKYPHLQYIKDGVELIDRINF
jgi:lipopolysaccharide biosynthesis glycosyltransferase